MLQASESLRLQPASNIVGVLVLVVVGLGNIPTVELLIQDLLGVLLALLGGVGVVDVSLVAAGNLSLRHVGRWFGWKAGCSWSCCDG